MTHEEAIQWLDKAKGNAEALRMAKEALEKAIPLEPHINQYTGTECYCRACGEYVGWIDALAGDLKKYCPECGQKVRQDDD